MGPVLTFLGRTHLRWVAVFALLAASLAAVYTEGVPLLDAQFSEEDEEIDELKEEREQAVKEAAHAASDIDVFEATVDELTEALDQLNALVELQEGRVEDAEKAHQNALDSIEDARNRQAEIGVEIDAVKVHMTRLAVSSFTGESQGDDEVTGLLLSEDPGESARFMHLLELQTGSLNDGIDRLRALETEAEQLVGVEQEAVEAAAALLETVEEREAELADAVERQSAVVTAAEIRLEAQVAEAAILAERDAELATEISDKQTAINQRVTQSARRNGIEIPPPVELEDIVVIDFYEPGVLPEPEIDPDTGEELPILIPLDVEPFFQVEVHKDIEEQTRRLYQAAFDQGIDLAGWGYRPIQLQIELRAAHCGGSEFDIWHKPVSQCSPPTARPGFSKHEQGRAIDFTFNGGSIRSRDSAGFRWLASNAPQYGFVNLPSEPWHWSINPGEERLPN